ncbi:MAG: hypothetical protein KDA20_10645 [Phycisphaerales bacterium]|nr:hypothetical protein [Phycisphaerales bacterium]
MKRLWAAVLALVGGSCVLAGCVTHDYVGSSFAPSSHVEVFYDASDVPAEYRVIGHDRAEATEYMTSEQIVQDIIKKAQSVGADAVLLGGVELVAVGATTNTSGEDLTKVKYYATQDGKLHTRHKQTGKWTQSSHTADVRDKVVTAEFLRKQ